MSGETLTERLAEAVEAWSWHEATDDTMAGYGFHMSQMLARLPVDSQTTDMQASINSMIADLTTLVTDLAAARAERDAAQAQVAAVAVLAAEWETDYPGPSASHHREVDDWWRDLRDALDQPGQAVARIKAEAWDECAVAVHVAAEESQIGRLNEPGNYKRGVRTIRAAIRRAMEANPYRADAIESEASL